MRQRRGAEAAGLLDEGPVAMPEDWLEHVNAARTEAELEAVRRSVVRGSPYGDVGWTAATVKRLGLEATLRPRGRTRKAEPEPSKLETPSQIC